MRCFLSTLFSRLPRLTLFACLLLTLLPGTAALADPIEPEKAFVFSARVISADTVEVRYQVRKGYYLYREKLSFSTDTEGVTLSEAQLPTGKPYEDPYFGKSEIYRENLVALLTVTAPPGTTRFTLAAKSQGCWDGGICYPPLTQTADLDLAAPSGSGGGGFSKLLSGDSRSGAMNTAADSAPAIAPALALDTPAGGAVAAAPAAPLPPASGADTAASGDESGRIASMLRDASPALVLASFFGFGLLLAFTPCTFPMLPILSGIIVGQGEHISRARAATLSAAYVLGMAVTYAAAGVAAGLSGTLLAAALQNVWVLSAFALVFVVLALAMFGFYELQLPNALQSRLSATASHQRGGNLGGVAVMGALSALIVGPCVAAPLAGALLYIAQTGDAVLGGVALFCMALGMGVPLLAIGVATRSILPRVGPWMEGVKKAFGVLLLAVALWLLTPVLPALAVMLAWAALLLFSGIFLHAIDPLPPQARNWQRFWKAVGVVFLIAGAAMLIGALAGSRDPLQPLAVLRGGVAQAAEHPRFERVASVAELEQRLAGTTRPVMLDFYADWCVSCKEMERFTFTDPAVAARMSQMLLLQADVTANSAEDKALLKRFALFGPPGIIFFDGQGRELANPRVVGFMKSDPFAAILDRVLTPPAARPLDAPAS